MEFLNLLLYVIACLIALVIIIFLLITIISFTKGTIDAWKKK